MAGVLAISCDARGRASPRDAETVAARQTEAVPLHFFERHLPRPRGAGGPLTPVGRPSTTERQRSGKSRTPTERAAAASAGMASITTTRFAPGSPQRKRRRQRWLRPILTSRPMPCFYCRSPVCACFRVFRRDGIMNTRSNIYHTASSQPMTRPREVLAPAPRRSVAARSPASGEIWRARTDTRADVGPRAFTAASWADSSHTSKPSGRVLAWTSPP